jgi:drug/metabolite transporter (DMT)-like permease
VNDRIPLGIMLGAIAYVLFTLHDAANKWLAQFFPVWQMMMFRSAVVVFFCLAIGRRALIERAIVTPAKLPMLWRGALTLTAWLLYYTAARQMPLAELQTLYFSSPIMTALLAIPLLGEKISRGRWVSSVWGLQAC